MTNKFLEKRKCARFDVPGTILDYKIKKFLSFKKYNETSCNVIDISPGGIRFNSMKKLNRGQILIMKVYIPGESIPFSINGIIRNIKPDTKNNYQIGVQFFPYGIKKGQNNPEILKNIISLEKTSHL